MRSFGTFIALGNVFNYLPNGHIEIRSMYNRVMKPTVPVIEENCGTTLGSLESINQGLTSVAADCPKCDNAPEVNSGAVSLIGKTDLRGSRETSPVILADSIITGATLDQYRVLGKTHINIRTLSTCVSKGGVCRKCLIASGVDAPAVGSKVSLNFLSEQIAFLSYLSKSYSGSLIGMKSYSGARLPLREALYEEVVLKPSLVTGFVRKIGESNLVSAIDLEYASGIQSSLEKVLFLLAQYQYAKSFNSTST